MHFRYSIKIVLSMLVSVPVLGQSPLQYRYEDIVAQEEPEESVSISPLKRYKSQALQRLGVSSGYAQGLASKNSHKWLQAEVGVGVPLGSFSNILSARFIFREDSITVPSLNFRHNHLYQLGASLFWRKEFTDDVNRSMLISVQPRYQGDMEAEANTFGIFAMCLINRKIPDTGMTFSYGLVHLNHLDNAIFPALGISWQPEYSTKIDLRFPESAVSWLLVRESNQMEKWLRLKVGFEGNRWGVNLDGVDTIVTSRHWKTAVVLEKLLAGGGGWTVELSYLFAREFEIGRDFSDLGDGVYLSCGINY